MSPLSVQHTPLADKHLQDSPRCGDTPGDTEFSNLEGVDPQLRSLVEAWAQLPNHVRQTISSLVSRTASNILDAMSPEAAQESNHDNQMSR